MSAPQITIDVNWDIATTGVTVIGNAANVFDVPTQSDTLGPYPASPSIASEEVDGEPGDPPKGK
jgi:hypothetical protein